MSFFTKFAFSILRPLWRMTRGMTMGAQAIVLNEEGEILLVRHGYRPGWHFPGGGVEWCESCEEALARELYEETGIEITGAVEFHGIFTNFQKFKGDHILVYIVRNWRQKTPHQPNAEIAEVAFFTFEALPEAINPGARQRLQEIIKQKPKATIWAGPDLTGSDL